jgi:ATP-dependent Lon protease
MDFRGDPSAALLEVLDPEQNSTFLDHNLDVEYDLSHVMFICTANVLHTIPQALRDRMEVLQLAGYTELEKVEIARKFLAPKAIEGAGLTDANLTIDDAAFQTIIQRYTREAGVRNLEREIANLARKSIKEILMKNLKKIVLSRRNLEKFAGVRRYRFGEAELEDLVGVTTGLAWTEVGGEILSIEAVTVPGKGKVSATGKLGDVMKESVQAAESYVKSRAIDYGIKPTLFERKDIHVHVPEGATPKDGPSAGVAMVTSIVSVLTGIPIKRELAMTGEITLRGRVLPIGGLKEKLLAALRAGIKTVVIPEENVKDLVEIGAEVKSPLEIIAASRMDDVLKVALLRMPTPITVEEEAAATVAANTAKTPDGPRAVTPCRRRMTSASPTRVAAPIPARPIKPRTRTGL